MALHQATCDPRGGATLLGRDDDTQAIVTAPPHGSTARIHHEADQEAKGRGKDKDDVICLMDLKQVKNMGKQKTKKGGELVSRFLHEGEPQSAHKQWHRTTSHN